eukprot:COSAG05_NODE_11265_length_522_cov_0.853428_1_plen_103_part_00
MAEAEPILAAAGVTIADAGNSDGDGAAAPAQQAPVAEFEAALLAANATGGGGGGGGGGGDDAQAAAGAAPVATAATEKQATKAMATTWDSATVKLVHQRMLW